MNNPIEPEQTKQLNNEIIYMSQRRVEEMDPVEIEIPEEEIMDPKRIEPTGNYGNNESPSNVDGAESDPEPDDIDANQADDDEDSPHPITPQTR